METHKDSRKQGFLQFFFLVFHSQKKIIKKWNKKMFAPASYYIYIQYASKVEVVKMFCF